MGDWVEELSEDKAGVKYFEMARLEGRRGLLISNEGLVWRSWGTCESLGRRWGLVLQKVLGKRLDKGQVAIPGMGGG